MLLLGAILTFLTVVAILKKSRITCQKPNIVRDGARPTIKYKEKGPPGMSTDQGMCKEKEPPGMSNDKGVNNLLTAQLGKKETKKEGGKIGNNRSHPGKFRRDEEPGLCPTSKLKA
ncbi:hypothetical protein ACM6QF_13135, partial [Enterococcus faecium]